MNEIIALQITAALIPPTLTAYFVNAIIIAELIKILNNPIDVSLNPKSLPWFSSLARSLTILMCAG